MTRGDHTFESLEDLRRLIRHIEEATAPARASLREALRSIEGVSEPLMAELRFDPPEEVRAAFDERAVAFSSPELLEARQIAEASLRKLKQLQDRIPPWNSNMREKLPAHLAIARRVEAIGLPGESHWPHSEVDHEGESE